MLFGLINKRAVLTKRSVVGQAGLARSIRRAIHLPPNNIAKSIFPSPTSTLDIDFSNDLIYIFGLGQMKLSDFIVPYYSRASSGIYYDIINGELTVLTAEVNKPRFSYDTTRQKKYYIHERASTNRIRNNTMLGVNPATNTAPTNWDNATTLNGLTRQIVGSGVENGIEYVDIRWSGTANATINVGTLARPDSLTAISASSGQLWCGSFYVKHTAGSLNNVTFFVCVDERADTGTFIVSNNISFVPNSSPLIDQRYSVSRSFNNVATTRAVTRLGFSVATGNSIDVTLRIGCPQFEQNGAMPTSLIKTTNAGVTRAADILSIPIAALLTAVNPLVGTFVTRSKCYDVSQTRNILSLSDGTQNNRTTLRLANASIVSYALSILNGVTQQTIPVSNPTQNQFQTLAMSYAQDYLAISREFSTKANTVRMTPPVSTNLQIGSDGDLTGQLSGMFERLIYFPRTFSQDAMQGISL